MKRSGFWTSRSGFCRRVHLDKKSPPPSPKKLTLGHLDKNGQKLSKNYLYMGSLFSRNRCFFSEKKKELTATQEEQGSKRGSFLHIYKKKNDVDRWIRVEKLIWLIKFSLRVAGTRALSWKDLGFEPRDLGFEKCAKNGRKKYLFPKNVIKISKINFPGLRTLRLAIWTCYFRVCSYTFT